MKTDNQGRWIIAPDPTIGFKRPGGAANSESLTTVSSVAFETGAMIFSTAAGNFDVTTWGGQRLVIPWCAYKPLPVFVKELHAASTTATGLFGLGLGLGPVVASSPAVGGKTLEQFTAMASIVEGFFWRGAIGYYPQVLTNDSGTLDLEELHAKALSFGVPGSISIPTAPPAE